MTPIDDRFLLDLDRLQHPKRHIAEILTGKENAARHFAADLSTATAEIHRILNRPGWGIETGADEADLAVAAMKASVASHRLVRLMGQLVEPKPGELASHRGWLLKLAAVLSVTSGRVIAPPSEITGLLSHMYGAPLDVDDDITAVVASVCSDSLLAQFPDLAVIEAPPALTDPGVAGRTRAPVSFALYIERIAADLPNDSWVESTQGEIMVLVKPLNNQELDEIYKDTNEFYKDDGSQPPA